MKTRAFLVLLPLLLPAPRSSLAGASLPKYGPEATVLSRSSEYARENPAPDFWALIPYYTAQYNERACSLASVTTVVNAARATRPLSSDDELATQPNVLKRSGRPDWEKAVGPAGRGVSLDELGPLAKRAVEAFGVEVKSVETVHVNDNSPATRALVRQALMENEKSARDFIIANFDQKVFTGDATVGHIAPIGAYDGKRKRVLVLDPDRQWYEPYWVSEETFVRGMNTSDATSGKFRGFVWIKLK